MAELVVRPARRAELRAAARVYLVADADLDARIYGGRSTRDAPPPGLSDEDEVLRDLTRAQDESGDNVWVAAERGEIVGMAVATVRERHWQLNYLFVLPHAQGRGIGRSLLERIHAAGAAAGCEIYTLFASDDPKALTRYLSLGLVPQPPIIVMESAAPAFPPLPRDDGFEAVPFAAGDVAALATVSDLDRAVRGVRRPRDLERWLRDGAVGALLMRRDDGVPAGYYLAGDEGKRGRIGPVVALDEARVPAAMARALAAAAAMARPGLRWRVLVPGQNRGALPPLLAAGFRPRYFDNFLASAPIGRFDRYVLHDSDYV